MFGTTHQSALVIIPPNDVWGPIQAIRRRRDPSFRRWMPHINLLYPFVDPPLFEATAPAIEEACRRLTPFTVALAHFQRVRARGGKYALWLAPQPVEPIVELQRALLQAVPECTGKARFPGRFTPHLTMARGAGKECADALEKDLERQWEMLFFAVDRVHVISRKQPLDDVFHLARTIPLGVSRGDD
ncbi:MAG: 2'-5' RNA ligase family protein [Pseudomonadota bacterium]